MSKSAVCLAAFAGVAASAAAQPDLILSEYAFQNARMTRLNADGSNPQPLFLLPPADWLPLGITFNASTQQLYWIDSAGSSEVNRSALNGSGQTTLANPPGFCRGIGLDASGRVYFSSNNQLMRAEADGSNVTPIFTSSSSDPIGNPRVDPTNAHVYVGAEGRIYRMDLDGSNRKTVVEGISQPKNVSLDIGAGYIYWIDGDTVSDYIGRARLDGTEFTVLIDNSPGVVESSGLIELLVDPANDNLYYATEFPGTILRRADLDGQGAATIYDAMGVRSPSGLTLVTGDPVPPLQDCDGNGINDDVDIAGGAPDCDNNGVLDSCQVDPCPDRVFLLDQESNAADSGGRALGWPSQWQVFQPFDVPAGGWTIGEIGLDGFYTNFADGTGIRATIFPDDGSFVFPDESSPLAATSGTFHLKFNTNFENWVYVPLSVSLAEGRYWVRIEAVNPIDTAATINHGLTGLLSRSKGSSGNFTSFQSPIALRLVEGSGCPADLSGSSDPNSPDYGDPDGSVDASDFFYYLDQFAAGNLAVADLTGSSDPNDPGYGVADGDADAEDFFYYLDQFVAGCN